MRLQLVAPEGVAYVNSRDIRAVVGPFDWPTGEKIREVAIADVRTGLIVLDSADNMKLLLMALDDRS